MRTTARLGTIAVAAAAAAALAAAPASAAPSKGETFDLDCGDAGILSVAVPPGNGDWTPGILTGSTRGVLVPVEFGAFSYEVLDVEGEVLFSDSEPGTSKGSRRGGHHTLVECELSQTFPAAMDPEILAEFPDAVTLTFSTTVSGYLNPARR